MASEFEQLAANLAAASGMVGATVLTHFWGLILLTYMMRRSGAHLRPHERRGHAAIVVLLGVFGIFAVHTAEIWLYAALYLALGETGSLEEALYFSTVTFASLGFGDIVLSVKWRVLSAIEAANGVILFAWSTAFLMTVTSKLRILEHDWLERG